MDMPKPRSLVAEINKSFAGATHAFKSIGRVKVSDNPEGADRFEREMVLDMDAVKRMPALHIKPSEDELYDYARRRYMNDKPEGAAARRRRKQMEKQGSRHGTD